MGDFGKNRLQFKVIERDGVYHRYGQNVLLKLRTCLIQLDGDYAELCLGILIQRTKLLLYRKIAYE